MYGFILTVHIIVSVGLILVVLLQAGKGAGISGLFGGGGNEAVFGGNTTPGIIKKTTTTMAVVFMITSLLLTIVAVRTRGRSLAEKIPIASQKPQSAQPAAPTAAPTTPAQPKK
ncbi:MAG: preprotein translocase subunit SecG [Elusimicrobia bacterium]|nr:preprotein translocase subunit SecG [Elusimicrobiota bacterium]